MQLWADLKSFHKVWTDLLCRKERMHLLYQPELRGWVREFCAVYHWQFLPHTGSTAGPTYGCRHTSDHMSGLKDRVTTGCQEIQVILHPGDSASHSDTYANKGMGLSPLLRQGSKMHSLISTACRNMQHCPPSVEPTATDHKQRKTFQQTSSWDCSPRSPNNTQHEGQHLCGCAIRAKSWDTSKNVAFICCKWIARWFRTPVSLLMKPEPWWTNTRRHAGFILF